MSTDILLIVGASLAGFGVAWDLGRRWLDGFSSVGRQAKDQLTDLVIRAETVGERNDAALKNFLAEIAAMVKYTERSRREAEGQLLTGANRGSSAQRR